MLGTPQGNYKNCRMRIFKCIDVEVVVYIIKNAELPIAVAKNAMSDVALIQIRQSLPLFNSCFLCWNMRSDDDFQQFQKRLLLDLDSVANALTSAQVYVTFSMPPTAP